MSMYVLQQTAATDTDGGSRTWTFSTHDIVGLPAGWEPRIIKAGNFERHAFGRGSVTGAPDVDFGVSKLNNRNGGLDDLQLAGVDGQLIRLWRGQPLSFIDAVTGRARDPEFSEMDLYLEGTTALSTYADGVIELQLRNRQAEVASLPVQILRYAGDNALPDGVEGTADDLKDAYKPIWLGYNENVPVLFVNTSKRIWQLSDNSTIPISGAAPTTIYDKGVVLTATKVQKNTWADFTHATGPSSEIWWYFGPEGWFIRLESNPAGTITVTAQEGSAATTTAGQLSRRILLARGVADGSIAGVDELDAVSPEAIGIWIGTQERSIGSVLGDILAGAFGTWTDDRSGVFTFARLEKPALEADHTFERSQLYRRSGEGFRILSGSEPGSPLPISEGVVLYRRNWTVQAGDDLAGSATNAFRAFAAEENRRVANDNSQIKVKHRLARPFERKTLFTTAAQATTAAARIVDLFGVRRFIVEVDLPTEAAAAVKLLQTISIPIGRFDWDTRNFRVVGIIDDLDEQTDASVTTLILWG
ncbi:hypothetical protein [Thalassobaculum litoreum]|uniref:Uncharacterized protein n=1 Tax=Thalassobaculum litoreum DSM 18839 TaxID=1123362 RepID=A0A8G2EYH8_9PROT|nr:hypothetical protein [Thalassobaculum litoreum]SDF83757.1 hypothetical protein SAMN05660686_02481 [Thalassobaculum litoreum DSM 18839]